MRTQLAFFVLALALPLVVASSAPAEEDEDKGCKAQIAQLCPDTEPNSPERRACAKENVEKLSADCRKRLGAGRSMRDTGAPPAAAPGERARFQQFLQACGSESDRKRVVDLCQTGGPSKDLGECLRVNQSEFSKPCQDWIRADAQALPAAAGGKAPAPAAP